MKSVKGFIVKCAVVSLWFVTISSVGSYAFLDFGGATSLTIRNASPLIINATLQSANTEYRNVRTEEPSNFKRIKDGGYETFTVKSSDRRVGYKGSKLMMNIDYGWGTSDTIAIIFNGEQDQEIKGLIICGWGKEIFITGKIEFRTWRNGLTTCGVTLHARPTSNQCSRSTPTPSYEEL